MKLSEELTARGFIHQHTGESAADIFDGDTRTIYHGIDPSADSAHAGNMVIWVLLRHLVNHGHKVIFLVGGGTGMIGDPKPDSERVLQDISITDGNVEKIKTQAMRLIGGGATPITFVNNKDWLAAAGLLTFLRDIGKHFTINELIKKDAISKRLESENGLSYTEFAYPLLQGYDYLVLHREHNCTVQIGGSDQWGNIISGVDLIRRKEQKIVHAVTVPLVVDKSTGKKFGKSEGNAVWLDATKTTPYQLYQFWLNTNDESVIDYLKLFTFLSLEEIKKIETDHLANPAERIAQNKLATAVVSFVHTKNMADISTKIGTFLFSNNRQSLTELSDEDRQLIKQHAPITIVAGGCLLIDILVQTGLASSKREAREFIEGGAVAINDTVVTTFDTAVTTSLWGTLAIVRRGKKNRAFIEIQ
jgi:tyrosyl-tRNA synthetase